MQKFTTILLLLFVFAGWCLIQAFKPISPRQKNKAAQINFKVPKGWPAPNYDFKKNPVTQAGFELGKKLFYDGRLSKDGNFACASCHQQFAAFSTLDHAFSHGINNGLTNRNAPGLFNLAWQKYFMWDGSIHHLDLQPIAPITATNEMGETMDSVILKLNGDKTYRKLFKAAFGSETITTQRLGKALSQFLVMLISNNSKYDRVMRGEDSFNLPQQLGYEIFKNKCASCHSEPLFTDFSYRNTGLPLDTFLKDYGKMKTTGNARDSLRFKVPSLRNVQVTFPYGHDGRFYSLNAVMEHYNTKANKSATTDTLLNKLFLNNFEMGQLNAFLYTLTDSAFLKDKRFRDAAYVDKLEAH